VLASQFGAEDVASNLALQHGDLNTTDARTVTYCVDRGHRCLECLITPWRPRGSLLVPDNLGTSLANQFETRCESVAQQKRITFHVPSGRVSQLRYLVDTAQPDPGDPIDTLNGAHSRRSPYRHSSI